jgi:hypothetical protein
MRYSAEYASGFSNHLPMATLAIRRLGASDERVAGFIEFYSRRLRPMDAEEEAESDRLHAELAREGREEFLRKHIARMTPGLASGAYHGIIRTAYAADSGEETDLPNAINSWIRSYEELGTRADNRRFADAREAFDAIRNDARFGGSIEGRSITGRIGKVAAMPAFDEYRSSIREVTLRDLARVAVLIYLATEDFTALHLVTGCHATRVLEAYLAEDALEHLATSMLAAYVTIGRPAFDVTPTEASDWDTIAKLAIASNDDHDLKMVYSCREEESVYGWGLHRSAAAARVRLRGDAVTE